MLHLEGPIVGLVLYSTIAPSFSIVIGSEPALTQSMERQMGVRVGSPYSGTCPVSYPGPN